MKEYVVKDTLEYTTYRVYKRLIKAGGKIIGYHIVNLTVSKKGDRFSFSMLKNNRRPLNVNFYVKNNSIRSFSLNGRNSFIQDICTLQRLFFRYRFSKYTQRKINRVLKNIFPDIKVKDHTQTFLLKYNFNSHIFDDIYRSGLISRLSPILKDVVKSKTIKDLVKRATGVCGKKTLKYFYKDIHYLRTLPDFKMIKTCLTHGDINNILKSGRFNYYCRVVNNELAKIIRKNKTLIRNLSDNSYSTHLFIDTGNVLKSLKDSGYTLQADDYKGNILEVHDKLSNIQRKQKVVNTKFKQYFENFSVDQYEVRLPEDTHTLVEWGDIMHNCVASYKNSHKSGVTKVLGIFEDDKLKYNVSIRNRRIEQFFGKCNKTVPYEIIHKVFDGLVERSLIYKHDINEIYGYNEIVEGF